ncbi:VOC family protein [Spirosoma soli]|uniref:VOC family protein n=1 Tax=Spirosoma soli TaxID=1770529 RepID=A0ABW5M1G7_9BACT
MSETLFWGVDHPAVAADDVEALADWYCTVLGYKKWFRHPKPVWMLVAPDNTLLEIMPKDDTSRPVRTTWTPGWSHLALRVANIEQAITWLDQHGVTWGGELINAIGGGRVRNFFDPDGNMLQILERPLPITIS